MKILYVQDSLGTGGAERSNAELWYFLKKKGVQFKIVVLDRRAVGIEDEIKENKLEVVFLKKDNFLNQARQIAEIIKGYKPCLVHSVLFRATMRVRTARIFTKFYHLESLVNTTYSKVRFADARVNQKALKLYKFMDKRTTWAVDHFHSITETVKDHYVQDLKINPQKITVVPRGRKPVLSSYEDKPKNTGKGLHLINVGRHEFQKGQVFLLKAVKKLKEKGYNFDLTILGREGSASDEMKKYIQEHSLEDMVKLEGFKHNVQEYLLKADLFVFPSLYEGLGGALIEAQAAGLPIACNDIPVLHEVVQKDKNGKFFKVHDEDSFIAALEFFFNNPEKLREYGKESLMNFQESFNEEVNNQRVLNLYKKLC